MPMDLKDLRTRKGADEGADLFLRNPYDLTPLVDDKTAEPVSIRLLGKDSAAYRQAEHAQQNRRLTQSQRMTASKNISQSVETDTIDLLARMTVGWKHIFLDGKELECTLENARTLYSDPGLIWIKEQVESFIATRANFLGNSSTT